MTALKIIRIVAWGAIVMLGGLVVGFSGLLPRNEQLPTAGNVARSGVVAIGGPFELTTHKGQTFSNVDVAGKPYLMFFGFTRCPDVCPTTLTELSSLMEELGSDADRVTPLFVTVDSERDNQQTLAEYMTAFDRRIIGLRGTPEQTDAAVKAYKAYYKKVPLEGGDYTIDHTAGVFLMSADGRFIGKLDMHEPRETRVAKLRRLVKKQSLKLEDSRSPDRTIMWAVLLLA